MSYLLIAEIFKTFISFVLHSHTHMNIINIIMLLFKRFFFMYKYCGAIRIKIQIRIWMLK